jgi:hypothetical protein
MAEVLLSIYPHGPVVFFTCAPHDELAHDLNVERRIRYRAGEDAPEIVFKVRKHLEDQRIFFLELFANRRGIEQASVIKRIHDAMPNFQVAHDLFLVMLEIVDDVALIGSANLTDDAFNRNMELGMLVKERATVENLSEHSAS